MDCKATSTERRGRARIAGATMVELVFAVGIGVMVLGVFMSFALYQGRSFSVILNLADMDQANRNAVDRMSKEIRQVNKVTYYGTNWIDFEDGDKATLTYRYSPGARTLTRVKGGTSTIILREVDSFAFALMQRNIVDGTYAYYPAETIEEAKVIGITWETSRSILGAKSGVSGNQVIHIVIRKA